VKWGVTGLAMAWIVGYPLLAGLSAVWVLPILGIRARDLLAALAPPVMAGLFMYLSVRLMDGLLAQTLNPISHLAALVATGGVAYGGFILIFARGRIVELRDLICRRTS